MGGETIVVTGFGPFSSHAVNASWEVAKLLHSLNIEEELDVKLITEEIPVSYDFSSKKIPELWETYQPDLMIHLGVSSIARELTLETRACKTGYEREDVDGLLPEGNECMLGEDSEIESCVADFEYVTEACCPGESDEVPVSISDDAGRYLCEFTYYNSLAIDKTRTLFIHVPDLDNPYSAEQLAQGVKKILTIIVQRIRTKCESDHEES